jgi:hypothetical protein
MKKKMKYLPINSMADLLYCTTEAVRMPRTGNPRAAATPVLLR